MSELFTNRITNRRILANNTPLLLTTEEIENPENVLKQFCNDFHLDRMKDTFGEVVSLAMSVDYEDLNEFTPREMLTFFYKIDLFLEAIYILYQQYDDSKYTLRYGTIVIANIPRKLKEEQIKNPETVIANLFENWSLEDIRALMHDIVIQAVCFDYNGLATLSRSDMVWFCEQIEMLIEAVFIIHQRSVK
jgi:hypothetical protein